MCLCEDCHQRRHFALEAVKVYLGELTPALYERVVGYALGLVYSKDKNRDWLKVIDTEPLRGGFRDATGLAEVPQ